jgi:hypothetical protein
MFFLLICLSAAYCEGNKEGCSYDSETSYNEWALTYNLECTSVWRAWVVTCIEGGKHYVVTVATNVANTEGDAVYSKLSAFSEAFEGTFNIRFAKVVDDCEGVTLLDCPAVEEDNVK